MSSEESEQTLINHYWLDRYHVLHYTYNFAKHNVVSPTRHDIYVERYMDTVSQVHMDTVSDTHKYGEQYIDTLSVAWSRNAFSLACLFGMASMPSECPNPTPTSLHPQPETRQETHGSVKMWRGG